MHPSLLVPLVLAAAAVGQADYSLRRTAPGVLGQSFTLAFSGATGGSLVLLIASTSNGPIPLAILNPSDPRVLRVGGELPALWLSQPLGSGSGTFAYPTPADPNLHGLTLQFQSCTLPGSPFVVASISNVAAVQLGEAGRAATLAATLTNARALAVSTGVDGTTGEVVVAGGGTGSILSPIGLDTSEIFDTQALAVRAGPRLGAARALAAAVTLGNGRTLICGGVDSAGNVLGSAELYDPAARTFTATGSMATARALHSAARLADGRVLVAGGTTTFSDPIAALANAQSTAEVYDPASGTWSPARSMARRLLAPGLHALGTGRTLVSGGFEVTVVFGVPLPIGSVASCQLYDAGANTWSNAAAMRQHRAVHATSAATLADGRLVLTGGATSGPDLTQAAATARAEVYDPAANTWTLLPDLAHARVGHSAALVGGRLIVAGGTQGTLNAPTPIASVEALDPSTSTWTTLPDLSAARGGHAAAVTADGLLCLLGGQGASNTLASVETLR
jgi:hypothetical protein